MKPKTYHQLKMTEIAKQKKPNAPSKSEFMSDFRDNDNESIHYACFHVICSVWIILGKSCLVFNPISVRWVSN